MKHFCIFEVTNKVIFVQDFGDDYSVADGMCKSMNNFKPMDKSVNFILRCLDSNEFREVQDFVKKSPFADVSKVYSPFINSVDIRNFVEL